MRRSRNGNTYDTDRWVRETPVFKPNDYDFVDNPPLRSTNDNKAEAISKLLYNKLELRTWEQFRIIIVQEKTLANAGHGIPQTVSMNRVTRAPETANFNHQQSTYNPNSSSRTN